MPKKYKTLSCLEVHDPSFVWMKTHARVMHPGLHQRQSGLGLSTILAKNNEVVGVPNEFEVFCLYSHIQAVQGDVGKQRTDDRALRSSLFNLSFPSLYIADLHHSLLQEKPDHI